MVIGTFLSSTDNGQTWEYPKFEPPITYGWLYGLARRGNSGFIAVGMGRGLSHRNILLTTGEQLCINSECSMEKRMMSMDKVKRIWIASVGFYPVIG